MLNKTIKFTNAGGDNTIAIEETDAGYTVCIRDNGRGIAKEKLRDVFAMFSQDEPSSNKTDAGLGIG